ncbi:DUF4390 domain-containing protein [Limnohabitans sp. T6-5]|uniref:DUF4390 domain-containing protein n=1 Tax=Limnohabitans sp. T6-5 TaxID=1100724 RepID=UPI001E5E4841|nr:DUF4390 domain-containing protein [Limnohabitans sp. T6-5]
MNTTGFITHCWKSAKLELWGCCRWALGALWLLSACSAWSQSSLAELTELRVERQDGALVLHAQLRLELGPAVEDALVKGLAVHFVAEAEVMRDRWYWYDRKLGSVSRYYRLAFQPLTRRWRLNVSNEPIPSSGLSSTISQNFESLNEALGVIRRQSGWKVANMADLDVDAHQYVAYRFRLDVSQLPRPFQIAAGNQADWNLIVSRTLRLNAESVR